jgi:hypothetical protein
MVWVIRKWVRVRVAVNVFAMKGVADGSVAVTVAVPEMVGVRVTVSVRVTVGVVDLVRVFEGTNPGMVAVRVAANGVFDRTLVGDIVPVGVRVNVVVAVSVGQLPGVAHAVAVRVGTRLAGLVLL